MLPLGNRKDKSMKRLYYRTKNAFVIAYWAFKNPESLNSSNFKMICDLLCLIMKVAEENRPVMSNVAYVHPVEGEKQIVSIWAGAGLGSSPTKRIAELLSENSELRERIAKFYSKP